MGNQPGKLQSQTPTGRPKKNVHWKSAERPTPPGRPILTTHPEQQPDTVNLQWEKPKLDGGSPIIGYIVEHRRINSPHWVRATPLPVTRCEISISGLEPGWRYQFRVFSENIVGRSDSSEISDTLTVTLQRNAITVPRFVDELRDKLSVENERIELRVRILGEPPPEINWFKDGYEIFSSRRMKIMNDNDSSILIIHQVALTDEGEIKCTATNRAGHVVTKAKLLVQAPPKIRLPRTYEDGLIVEADETLRLKVGIAGQPQPGVTWLHEGNVILNNEHFETSNTDKNSLLKINHIKRDDRGEYTVKAFNKLGEDVTSFLVTVTSRPDPPGKVRLNMSFGKSATLSWTAPIDDGGCKIGNYIVEYFRIGWNVWLKAATVRSLTTTLHDLIEGSEYRFRVKAENPYGLSNPSEESDILFIPDSKRGIIKPKSTSKLSDKKNPVPPRRKAPPQQKSSNNVLHLSPIIAQTSNPQLLDNVNLHREMSYGTSDKLLKMDIRKFPSLICAQSDIQNKNLHLDSKEDTSESTLNISSSLKISQEYLDLQLNVPQKNPTSTASKKPFQEQTNSKKATLPQEAINKHLTSYRLSSVKRVRSLSPSTEPSLSKVKSVPTNSTLALLRSAEPVDLFHNQPLPEHCLSPAKHAPLLAIAIATSTLGKESKNSATIKKSQIQNTSEHIIEKEMLNTISNIEEDLPNKTHILPCSHCTSPEIIVRPTLTTDKQEDVHTSNEFMLVVFNKNSKVKKNDKQNSFELDLEEAIQLSSISISAPELAFLQFSNLHTTFPLRRSVSSSELLYERAMARFYEAVELEEVENLRRNQNTSSKINQLPNNFLKRISSMTETEFSPFERNSVCACQPANINKKSPNPQSKWKSDETSIENKNPKIKEQRFEKEDEGNMLHKQLKYELGSDYTDSTASSEEDSIEKFKIELMARTRSLSPRDLETYHPHNMSAGTFTPYRATSSEQAAIVLNRPKPFPSPDFIPKPILKRPLKESDEQINTIETKPSNKQINERNIKEVDLSKNIKGFFNHDKCCVAEKSTETIKLNTKLSESIKTTDTDVVATKIKEKYEIEEEDFKRVEEVKIINEEDHAAVNHYNDLMYHVSRSHKYHKPLYLDRDELKKVSSELAYEDNCTENSEKQLLIKPHIPENELILIPSPTICKTRLSISERGQMIHVRQTPSNLAVNGPQITPAPTTFDILNNNNTFAQSIIDSNVSEVSKTTQPVSRGRTRLVKVKRIIKRRVPSSTHSRDASSSGLPPNLISITNNDLNISKTGLMLQAACDKLLDQHFDGNEHSQSETHEKVRSALCYSTDFVLFVVACYVYLFKDARLVLPILALMIYRHIGKAINGFIPDWIKRKRI